MNNIRARFMHQHKDKAVLDVSILCDSIAIGMQDEFVYAEFELPIFNELYPKAITRLKPFNCVYSERELVLETADGDILRLPKRSYELCMCIFEDKGNALLYVRFFELSKEELEWLYKFVGSNFAN